MDKDERNSKSNVDLSLGKQREPVGASVEPEGPAAIQLRQGGGASGHSCLQLCCAAFGITRHHSARDALLLEPALVNPDWFDRPAPAIRERVQLPKTLERVGVEKVDLRERDILARKLLQLARIVGQRDKEL